MVVPARDEGATIARAVGSLLEQDYPEIEVIVVDDRSSDATGEVLRDLAEKDRRLLVLHVDELPAGWLGKNHALWLGAARASGEWLLFTDADVVPLTTSDGMTEPIAGVTAPWSTINISPFEIRETICTLTVPSLHRFGTLIVKLVELAVRTAPAHGCSILPRK